MELIDTHVHLDDPRFDSGVERHRCVENAAMARVRALVVPGVRPAQWEGLNDLVAQIARPGSGVIILTGIGIHPQALEGWEAAEDDAALAALQEAERRRPPHVVAIGECGLDLRPKWRKVASEARQRRVLEAHLALARRSGLPLLLHCVDAHAVLLELLTTHPAPPSVLHGYSGSAELVASFVALGHYVSFAGSVTLPGARRPVLAARAVPGDRLLVETDAPDQTPVARRPRRNEPAFLVDVASAVARVRDETLEEVAATTTANAERVLGSKVVR